jgi:uncharacterized membrane protein
MRGIMTASQMIQIFWPRRFARFIWLSLAGLTLAALIHLLVILTVPVMAEKDAASLFGEYGEQGKVERVDLAAVVDSDPFTAVAVCAYDLGAGAFRVSARTGDSPLSLSLHRRGGGVTYAITDRAAVRGLIEFVVLTPRQLEERLARDDEGDSVRELRVVSPGETGIVVARALIRRPSDRADAEALVAGVACGLAE